MVTWFLFSAFFNNQTRANDASTCMVFLEDIATMGALFEDAYMSFAMHQMEHQNRFSPTQRMIDFDLIGIQVALELLTNFCEQNPDREFVEGVNLLYMQFPEVKWRVEIYSISTHMINVFLIICN